MSEHTQHVLVVQNEMDYMPPDVFGPFDTVAEGQTFAEGYRREHGLPVEATPENNEAWTDAGWYFGIVPLTKDYRKAIA